VFLLLSSGICTAEIMSPSLRIQAPPGLEKTAHEIDALGREDFSPDLELVGQEGFQRVITVVLLEEKHPVARETPPGIAGFARGEKAVIVLFPARVRSYPNGTLRALLHHELTHILVWEATEGRPVPRWFNEGLAIVAAREWGFGDRARSALALLSHPPRSFHQLDRAFSSADPGPAYALSAELMRRLRAEYGAGAPALILREISRGKNFRDAFFEGTGCPLDVFERRFLRRRRSWTDWIVWLSSVPTLWLPVSFLAFGALLLHRKKRMKRREEMDDGNDEENLEIGKLSTDDN